MWAVNLLFISGSETAIFMLLVQIRACTPLCYSVWKTLLTLGDRTTADAETNTYHLIHVEISSFFNPEKSCPLYQLIMFILFTI
jgi:hypothetical protein